MVKKIFTICILISLGSCGVVVEPMPKSWNWGIKPRPLTGVRGFPETDTDYGKGFKAGCEAAWQQSTKGLKDLTRSRFNPILMAESADYNTGWYDGNEQCTYIVDWDVT